MSNDSMHGDARRNPRHRVGGTAPVVDTISHRALGVARDLSASGMQLAAPAPLVDDALYQVEIELGGAGGEPLSIEAGVQVVNQRREGNDVLVGMRFIHLDAGNGRRLSRWLAAQDAPGQ